MANNTNKVVQDKGIIVYKKIFPNTQLLGIVFKIQIKVPIKKGLAHLTEHLICNQVLNFKNLIVSGNTTVNNISIKILGIKKDVQNNLTDIISSIVNPEFSSKQLINEKEVILQEINDYKIQKMQNFANIAREKVFNKSHIEEDSVLGSSCDLNKITMEDVHKFLHINVCYSNVRVLVSGSHIQKTVSKISRMKFKSEITCQVPYDKVNQRVKDVQNQINRINYTDKSNIVRISYIKRVFSSDLNQSKIIALSLLLASLSGDGEFSIIKRLKRMIRSIYFVRIIPVFRGNNIYFQILSSCYAKDSKTLIKIIDETFNDIGKNNYKNINESLKNYITLQHARLFDGVEKSINSFSNMEREQEEIIDLCDVDWNLVGTEFMNLLSNITENRNILIDYK